MDISQRTSGTESPADVDDIKAHARAKRPRNPLAGPYGHPFHPILVTIPIGAWLASVVFDIAGFVRSKDQAVAAHGAYWLIAIGVVGAFAAAVVGLVDLSGIKRGTRAYATGLTHMVLNLIVVALFIADFVIRRSNASDATPTSAFVLSVVAVGILGVSGWLGGKLSYRYGVRVSEEVDQLDGFTNPPNR